MRIKGINEVEYSSSPGSTLDHEMENLYASNPMSFIILTSSYQVVYSNI